jgi:hypothetical protein
MMDSFLQEDHFDLLDNVDTIHSCIHSLYEAKGKSEALRLLNTAETKLSELIRSINLTKGYIIDK